MGPIDSGTKHALTSKGVIGGIIGDIVSLLILLGAHNIGPVDMKAVGAEGANIEAVILGVAGLIASSMAIYGRVTAQKRLTL